MDGGYLDHNPAWRTYKYSGKKKEKTIADEETMRLVMKASEKESIKYEAYFKLIIVTGMRRGACCGLKWSDIDFKNRAIHVQRNVVKITGEEIFVKEPKTSAGDRYVYFSPKMESLLKEYRHECDWQTESYENRKLTDDDYVFRKSGCQSDHAEQSGDLNLTVKKLTHIELHHRTISHKKSVKSYDFTDFLVRPTGFPLRG